MELQTPRGMRDFMPDQMTARKKVISVVERLFKSYGYEPFDTPALELMETLMVKCGDETNKQIYRVEDGKLGMRFDLTVPLARVVASDSTISKPFKRYCIDKVWRREEPQKGRYREFLQADIDVIGSSGMECEAELLACASECLKALGFKKFSVKVNNRKILDSVIKRIGITSKPEAVFRVLDKLEKTGEGAVRDELLKAGLDKTETDELMSAITEKGNNESRLKAADNLGGKDGADELRYMIELCKEYGIDVSVDLSLVRGLDYYTGPVFEISAGEGIGSIAGGGRYDDLIETYSGQNVPAVGISLGIERIMALLDGDEFKGAVDVYIATVKPELYGNSIKVANELRSYGLNVQIDLMKRNLRKQFEYVNSKNIGYIGVIGPKEVKEKTITLRDLKTGEEKAVTPKQAADIIKS